MSNNIYLFKLSQVILKFYHKHLKNCIYYMNIYLLYSHFFYLDKFLNSIRCIIQLWILFKNDAIKHYSAYITEFALNIYIRI